MEGHPAHTQVARQEQANGLARYLPILGWLPTYRGEWLRGDLLAGLTVVALPVPEGMAYAELAGMPPQAAFYAAPAGLVLLHLEMRNELDAPGADALADLHEELARRGTALLLSRVHSVVRETLDRGGVTARIGADRIYRRSLAAALDFAATVGDGPAPEKE